MLTSAKPEMEMESIGVLMLNPIFPLEQVLDKRFNLLRAWNHPRTAQFLRSHASSIRAVVLRSISKVDANLIEALPELEIVSNFGVGVDKIDLDICKQKGIRVTNTPDVLTDEVADLAIGLILALLRRLCDCDGYVRNGKWKHGDYNFTTKVLYRRLCLIVCECHALEEFPCGGCAYTSKFVHTLIRLWVPVIVSPDEFVLWILATFVQKCSLKA